MKRSQPLKRATRLKPKRATKRKSRRVHSPEYMAKVRLMPCLAEDSRIVFGRYAGPALYCDGPIQAHHMGERGLGQKCSDLETVPFCERHHRAWHDATGWFAGKSKEWRHEFARAAIEQTQAELMPKKEEQ